MYCLCSRFFFFKFEGNRSVKAGLRPTEEAMGGGPHPPHAPFLSFYFGPTVVFVLHFHKKKRLKQNNCYACNLMYNVFPFTIK